MIVDVVMFDQEFDILDARLHELRDVVDRFFICEADHTFSGIPKPYHLTEAMQEGAYEGRPIEVFRAQTKGDTGVVKRERAWITPETMVFWWREQVQRRAANHVLEALPRDTVVLYGDLDEIPRARAIKEWDGIPRVMVMRHLVYSLRRLHPGPWAGTVIGTIDRLGPDPHGIRETRGGFPAIEDAGWHLSWFGGPDGRTLKYTHQAHQELGTGDLVGVDLPERMLHVDAMTPLLPYDDEVPSWAAEGHCPSIWWER